MAVLVEQDVGGFQVSVNDVPESGNKAVSSSIQRLAGKVGAEELFSQTLRYSVQKLVLQVAVKCSNGSGWE